MLRYFIQLNKTDYEKNHYEMITTPKHLPVIKTKSNYQYLYVFCTIKPVGHKNWLFKLLRHFIKISKSELLRNFVILFEMFR